jgi:hypothetical protein
MKRLLILPIAALSLLSIGASDCSGSGNAGLPSSGQPSAAAASVPASAAPPVVRTDIVLKGTNGTVSDPFEIPSGTYRVTWKADGNSNFIVHLKGVEDTGLINEILNNPTRDWKTGQVPFTSAGGRFIATVDTGTAFCFSDSPPNCSAPVSWQLTFTWLA